MTHDYFHNTVSFLLAVALVFFLLPGEVAADGLSERRAWVGLDLFPTFLAADNQIDGKKGEDGTLHLLLVHRGRRDLAEEMAEQLAQVGEVRGIPIRVSEVEVEDLENTGSDTTAGVFLVERLGDGLEAVVRFGQERHVIVFSPFAGDVEAGASSGLVISDRILPYVNIEAMRLSGVHIKSFFLRVAERYGE